MADRQAGLHVDDIMKSWHLLIIHDEQPYYTYRVNK